MKKLLHLPIFLVAAIALMGTSCKKDFLERYPQTAIPPELFFKSEEDLNLYITGLLTMNSRGSYISDQDTDDKATTGAMEIKTMMNGSPTSQNVTAGWGWGRLRNINYFMDNYARANVNQEAKDHYAGLARYYRAMFYMDKVKRFSDVPWYSTALNPSDSVNLYKPRDPRTLVMDSVMADLAFAGAHVREAVPVGTPGKWVVKLMQARVALYEGTYRLYHPELNLKGTATAFLDTAIKVSEEIRLSKKYEIYTSNPATAYGELFNSASLTANKEVMLVNIYDQDLKKSGNNNGNIINYEQSPSRDLVQTYLMADGTRFTDKPNYQTQQFVQEFTGRDPRLSQTMFYPGLKLAVNAPNVAVPHVVRLNKNFSGYHQLKGYINSTDSKILDGADFPAYRYAEVLLILAEAKAERGSLTQEDLNNSINLIRNRVNMPALVMATANANTDPVLAAKYPDVSGANKGVILEIRRERRVELAMEGFRFDDVNRWHAGKELEKIPEGMYFPGLGKYDLTGDGIEDIILVDKGTAIPPSGSQETNSLGVKLVYYKAGLIGEDVTVYLKNGNSGGPIVTETRLRNFKEPQYYYRPVPFNELLVNPKLAPQLFSWQ
ncbi:RagB/SusD family nutrient uptake outer membrane protein [Chitinophaga sp. SYP-B3965]|uniref:RagB/SusD family nutrient uptake outer membrane protein n=1 Tax=Chitinophaga sp. SYP-B3965 TaxID=2663120 RepID=UPI001299A940|nr:RagB/SusD family nutrient uptake outer membrane protein [Chitinophaga sp. SYP-B3965]MRG47902.1 RagB/SusD family nutrient uptake outer membrane protein [Chitinophaga sp. SYP-B3965]